MGGGLENRCVGRVYGADGAVRHHPHRPELFKMYTWRQRNCLGCILGDS